MQIEPVFRVADRNGTIEQDVATARVGDVEAVRISIAPRAVVVAFTARAEDLDIVRRSVNTNAGAKVLVENRIAHRNAIRTSDPYAARIVVNVES